MLSLNVFDEIKENVFPSFSRVLERTEGRQRWHGILAAYTTAPFYFFSGTSQDAGVMLACIIFLSMLIVSTFGIAKIISIGKPE